MIPFNFERPSLPPPHSPRPARVHQFFEELVAVIYTLKYIRSGIYVFYERSSRELGRAQGKNYGL